MDTLALILAIIGAVNWGLVGFARFDLVAWIFGGQTASVSRIIYAVVGLAGLWCITLLFRRSRKSKHEPKKFPDIGTNRCPGIAFYLRLQRMMHSKLLPP